MSKRLEVLLHGQPCYDIVFEQDYLALAKELKALGSQNRRICIVTDSRVGPLYASPVEEALKPVCRELHVFAFPQGEGNKTLDTVQALYRFLIEHRFDRKDILAALGGGVVGDLCGYGAATYLRGIDFIQLPTSLLAQVDSSIGGKTGVDFDCYKNMVGAFKMPRLVYISLSTLSTLDGRQFASGFAEVMKHGLIRDEAYYEWLLSHMEEINGREPGVMEEMVLRSCLIKKAVVEKDPLEQGERALLNFGHTIGHALEKAKNFSLLHGECVALGAVAAAFISLQKGLITHEEYGEIRDMFVPFQLPISVEDIDPEAILKLTRADKKMERGRIKFILLEKIGRAVIDPSVTEAEMLAGLEEILYRNEG